jgi:hypothetical protein
LATLKIEFVYLNDVKGVIVLKNIYKVFLVVIVFLSIIDVTCTYFYVRLFGLIAEANTVVVSFIQAFGLVGGLFCSLSITLTGVFLLWKFGHRLIKITSIAIVIILIVKIAIVIAHIYWIIQI